MDSSINGVASCCDGHSLGVLVLMQYDLLRNARRQPAPCNHPYGRENNAIYNVEQHRDSSLKGPLRLSN
jgi:hypothetical protein